MADPQKHAQDAGIKKQAWSFCLPEVETCKHASVVGRTIDNRQNERKDPSKPLHQIMLTAQKLKRTPKNSARILPLKYFLMKAEQSMIYHTTYNRSSKMPGIPEEGTTLLVFFTTPVWFLDLTSTTKVGKLCENSHAAMAMIIGGWVDFSRHVLRTCCMHRYDNCYGLSDNLRYNIRYGLCFTSCYDPSYDFLLRPLLQTLLWPSLEHSYKLSNAAPHEWS